MKQCDLKACQPEKTKMDAQKKTILHFIRENTFLAFAPDTALMPDVGRLLLS